MMNNYKDIENRLRRHKDITLGFRKHNNDIYKITLAWNDWVGMLIAGRSGFGKTQTVAYYLTSLAKAGAQLIVADFGSMLSSKETLLNRIEHLSPSFLIPPTDEVEGIVGQLAYVNDLYQQRRINKSLYHFPVVFVVDEFSAFTTSGRKQAQLEDFLRTVNMVRKANIRFILIGQYWQEIGTRGMSALRNSFSTRIIHNTDKIAADLLGVTDVELQKQIAYLLKGYAYYNERIMYIASSLNESIKQETTRRCHYYSTFYKNTAHLSIHDFLVYINTHDFFGNSLNVKDVKTSKTSVPSIHPLDAPLQTDGQTDVFTEGKSGAIKKLLLDSPDAYPNQTHVERAIGGNAEETRRLYKRIEQQLLCDGRIKTKAKPTR